VDRISEVLVIGSGPIIIGQAAEFDYSGTQAAPGPQDNVYLFKKFVEIIRERRLAKGHYTTAY